ncbi:hypothetical protein HYH03_014262 [Edaphochlamys debaryana]|uniref:Peptidase S8/S53 domain-containing protein n=1 Tax=Edaphochlamys debaryana TaxID=47281 RepID=A0A836BTS5_9CHLO|nr:hypothetical protein HYH03_014262 [Edaphochlamys debaryana]|eukprot:KAG2487149.1 hypothetical protein HYH03_014262 [Edaphochlamys debaryana]
MRGSPRKSRSEVLNPLFRGGNGPGLERAPSERTEEHLEADLSPQWSPGGPSPSSQARIASSPDVAVAAVTHSPVASPSRKATQSPREGRSGTSASGVAEREIYNPLYRALPIHIAPVTKAAEGGPRPRASPSPPSAPPPDDGGRPARASAGGTPSPPIAERPGIGRLSYGGGGTSGADGPAPPQPHPPALRPLRDYTAGIIWPYAGVGPRAGLGAGAGAGAAAAAGVGPALAKPPAVAPSPPLPDPATAAQPLKSPQVPSPANPPDPAPPFTLEEFAGYPSDAEAPHGGPAGATAGVTPPSPGGAIVPPEPFTPPATTTGGTGAAVGQHPLNPEARIAAAEEAMVVVGSGGSLPTVATFTPPLSAPAAAPPPHTAPGPSLAAGAASPGTPGAVFSLGAVATGSGGGPGPPDAYPANGSAGGAAGNGSAGGGKQYVAFAGVSTSGREAASGGGKGGGGDGPDGKTLLEEDEESGGSPEELKPKPQQSDWRKREQRKAKYRSLMCCCFWLLLVGGAIAAAIAVPICVVRGCPPKDDSSDVVQPEEGLYNLRLLSAASNPVSDRIADLIPPILRGFVNVTRLEESFIEFLDCADLGVLREVRKQLTERYADKIAFLVPDFPVYAGPDLNEYVVSGLAAAGDLTAAAAAALADGGGDGLASLAAALGAGAAASGAGGLSGAALTDASAAVAELLRNASSAGGSLESLTALLPEDTRAAIKEAAAEISAAADPDPAAGSIGGLSFAQLLAAATSAAGSLLGSLQGGTTDAGGAGSQNHTGLVEAAAAGEAKGLSGVLPAGASALSGGAGGSPSGSGSADGGASDGGALAWYLRKAGVPGAWQLTRGAPEVVVAVLDTGFDVRHPDLQGNLWVNPGEVPGNGLDDDGNGYTDDVNGYDFAGSAAGCQGDWRQQPPPSVPPPAPPPPPPPAKPNKRRQAVSRVAKKIPPATSPSDLKPLCRGDGDVSPEQQGDNGHGTHVAGIVAAARDAMAGVAGAAPAVKIMALKVFDAQGRLYASHVAAAYAYALRMGAHIVSCSFGPAQPNLQPMPYEVAEMKGQAAVYGNAVGPLEAKGVLLVAAAGNELTNLDGLAAVGSNYLPCTLPNGNVLCVTGSNSADGIITGWSGNALVGVNYGANTVHIAAPGQDVYNTIPVAMGSYGNKTGSSMATPLVAGAAALVASLVGAAGAAADDPNFYQAARIKQILTEAADALPGLPVRGGRRLNAARAVAAAAAAATNGSYLLTPSSAFYTVNGGSASLLAAGLSEEYFVGTYDNSTSSVDPAVRGFTGLSLSPQPFDVSVRSPSGVPGTRLRRFKYSPSTLPSATASLNASSTNASTPGGPALARGQALVLRLSGLLRLGAPGAWGVALQGQAALGSVRLAIGQRLIAFPSVPSRVTLLAQSAGMYDFELLLLSPEAPLELRWSAPGSKSYGAAPDDLFAVPSYDAAVHPRHAPNVSLPGSPSAPAGWQLLWGTLAANASTPADAALSPAFLRSLSAALPPPSGPSAPGGYLPLRNSAFTQAAALFPTPGAFGQLAVATAAAANPSPSASPSLVAPDPATTAAFGAALALLAPPASGLLALRATCSSCAVYLQGALVIDASQTQPLGTAARASSSSDLDPPPLTAASGCIYLPAATQPGASSPSSPGVAAVYTLEVRFVIGDLSNGVLTVAWSPCSAAGPTGQWSSLDGLLTSLVMWAPPTVTVGGRTTLSNAAVARPGMRCDLWESNGTADGGVVPSPRVRQPLVSYNLPRPGSRNQNCSIWSNNPNCSFVAQLNALDVLPGAPSGGPGYHVRCWAYWLGGFRGGTLAVRGAFQSSSPAAVASVYLGHQQVFRSPSPDTPPGGPGLNRLPLAPWATWLGPYAQLLAFEYADVSSGLVMGLLDGMEGFSQRDLLAVDERMLVPAGLR